MRRKKIDSAALASVLTAERWTDRVLGETRMITLPNRALWLATSNNPRLSMEIARRCVRVRLDPRVDRPWLRREFKHPHIVDWVRKNRARLVGAALTLVRAWQAAGSPLCGARLGSFEQWSAIMGGILEVAGVPGFLANQDELYESADVEGEMWRAFVSRWWDTFGDEQRKVSDLNALCESENLMVPVRGDGTWRSQQTRLGNALHKSRDRVFEGLRITRVTRGRHKGGAAWRLVREEGPRDQATDTSPSRAGDPGDVGSSCVPTSPSLSDNELRGAWGPWGPSSRPTRLQDSEEVQRRQEEYVESRGDKVPNVPKPNASPCGAKTGTYEPCPQQGPQGTPKVPRLGGLPPRVTDWPEKWRYLFEERASIMEVEGCLGRDEAERGAEVDVRRQFKEEEG